MTGAEHYSAAQSHLDRALDTPAGSKAERWHLRAAQVHATLALAAATAASGMQNMSSTEGAAWRGAAGRPVAAGES